LMHRTATRMVAKMQKKMRKTSKMVLEPPEEAPAAPGPGLTLITDPRVHSTSMSLMSRAI
jgi:hypothetical protein